MQLNPAVAPLTHSRRACHDHHPGRRHSRRHPHSPLQHSTRSSRVSTPSRAQQQHHGLHCSNMRQSRPGHYLTLDIRIFRQHRICQVGRGVGPPVPVAADSNPIQRTIVPATIAAPTKAAATTIVVKPRLLPGCALQRSTMWTEAANPTALDAVPLLANCHP